MPTPSDPASSCSSQPCAVVLDAFIRPLAVTVLSSIRAAAAGSSVRSTNHADLTASCPAAPGAVHRVRPWRRPAWSERYGAHSRWGWPPLPHGTLQNLLCERCMLCSGMPKATAVAW